MGGDPSASECTEISAAHRDIIQTHILTRLDGATIASVGCASAQLHALSADEKLWQDICNQTWPSTAEPRLRRLISTFSAGHRSFYSGSFPTLHHRFPSTRRLRPPTPNLISAVDVRFQNKLIYSKFEETVASDGFSLSSTFRIQLLDPKETVPMPVKIDYRDDSCETKLEQNLTITWILIDPTGKRAANISSVRPVVAERNWCTNDIELRYVTFLAGDQRGELVQCVLLVTCGAREGGELHVRKVSLQVVDMEGKKLSWKDSLVILDDAVKNGERRRRRTGEEREKYEDYLKMKRERRERKRRKEMGAELALTATCAAAFAAGWVFLLFKFLQLLQLF